MSWKDVIWSGFEDNFLSVASNANPYQRVFCAEETSQIWFETAGTSCNILVSAHVEISKPFGLHMKIKNHLGEHCQFEHMRSKKIKKRLEGKVSHHVLENVFALAQRPISWQKMQFQPWMQLFSGESLASHCAFAMWRQIRRGSRSIQSFESWYLYWTRAIFFPYFLRTQICGLWRHIQMGLY